MFVVDNCMFICSFLSLLFVLPVYIFLPDWSIHFFIININIIIIIITEFI